MLDDVRYRVRIRLAPWMDWQGLAVAGMRVGRFAVRMKYAFGTVVTDSGRQRECRSFVVDHINAGASVGDFATFEDALAFADDISRFAQHDPSSSDHNRLLAQLGPDIQSWVTACRVAGNHIPFRQWRAQRIAA